MRLLNKLCYKIGYFFKAKIPFISPLWYEYHFPYQHWWKARKVFKRPKIHFTFSKKKRWFFGLPVCDSYYNRFIDIRMSALGWKTKFSSFRHEWDPYISILLFKKYHFLWIFNWVDPEDKDSYTESEATWEAILEYDYAIGDILADRHIWKSQERNITIKGNLK